ncbi:MAG: J domain-containing protein [Cyclobacteriaceae bacterium]
MQNQYLDILELQPGASKSEVKKAYRRLSKRYHPDVSKDPHAKERFIEISEAYQFLTQVGPAPNQEPITYNYDPQVDHFEEARRSARQKAYQRAREVERMQNELIKRILRGFDWLGYLMLVFNFLLAVDYLMPWNDVQQKIVDPPREEIDASRMKRYHPWEVVYFEDYRMEFDYTKIVGMPADKIMRLQVTPIFNKPMTASFVRNDEIIQYRQTYNVFYMYGFIIVLIFPIFFLYRFIVGSLDTKLTLAIFMLFLAGLQLIIFNQA